MKLLNGDLSKTDKIKMKGFPLLFGIIDTSSVCKEISLKLVF